MVVPSVSKGKNPPGGRFGKSQRECGIDGSVICEKGKESPGGRFGKSQRECIIDDSAKCEDGK